MTGKGYIKLHRDAVEHTVFKSALAWQMFTGILMTCDNRTCKLDTSYIELADMFGMKKQNVKRVLDKLVEMGCIEYTTIKKNSPPTTFITVKEWLKLNKTCK